MNANTKLFIEGRDLWANFIVSKSSYGRTLVLTGKLIVSTHGYSWEPTDKGLNVLAETTGIKKSELRMKIHAFLSA